MLTSLPDSESGSHVRCQEPGWGQESRAKGVALSGPVPLLAGARGQEAGTRGQEAGARGQEAGGHLLLQGHRRQPQ